MNGRENTTYFWASNTTLHSLTENTTIVEYTYTPGTTVGHYQCDNYDLFMGFFVKVCLFYFLCILKKRLFPEFPCLFASDLHAERSV